MSDCCPEIEDVSNVKKWILPANVDRAGNDLMLGSREERVALLKAGFNSKDIESIYLLLNGITIIGVKWKD